MYYMTGATEGSTESESGESGDRACDPWFTRHSAYPLHHGGFYRQIEGIPMSTKYAPVVTDLLCWL